MVSPKGNLSKAGTPRFETPDPVDYQIGQVWVRLVDQGSELYMREATQWKFIGYCRTPEQKTPTRYIYKRHPKDIPFTVLSPI